MIKIGSQLIGYGGEQRMDVKRMEKPEGADLPHSRRKLILIRRDASAIT